MFISDHLNLAFASPLAGPQRAGEPRWPDLHSPYDPAWLDRAERLALERGIARGGGSTSGRAGRATRRPPKSASSSGSGRTPWG
jgi:hypothetical protein